MSAWLHACVHENLYYARICMGNHAVVKMPIYSQIFKPASQNPSPWITAILISLLFGLLSGSQATMHLSCIQGMLRE